MTRPARTASAMAPQRTSKRWTYSEFARLPSEGSSRHEIIAGELVVTPGPTPGHQRVVMRLTALLHAFVEERKLGEVFPGPIDVLFAQGDYLEPDVVFVRRGRGGLVSDRGVKLERYRHFGVGEYWIVDPDARTVEVWKVAAGAEEPLVLGEPDSIQWSPLPGGKALKVPVERMFG